MLQHAFRFTVQHVFYIPPPVDRVSLVGTVDDGSVQQGDTLIVRCRTGEANVEVEAIETLEADIPSAAKGQQVGLRLRGLAKDQVRAGDQVTCDRIKPDRA